ncbi:MAG TPA: hypothetical protein VI796_03870, partial [Candidatus Thermoplasmatota archaeon]|nr:hypothetical protein [Candidatus Thermoplasmatota archaeon]
ACGVGTERAVYITTDESTLEVREAARSAGWGIGHVQVVDLQTQFAEAMLDAQQRSREGPSREAPGPPRRRFDPRELVEGTSSRDALRPPRAASAPAGAAAPASATDTDYLGRLLDPYTRLRSPDRMVVNSLDFFLNLYPVERVVAVLTALKAANAKAGGQLLLVLLKGAHGATVERRLELFSDCLIELEVTRKGTTFERFFMVRKVKNRSHGIGVSTYDIRPSGVHLETLERIV